MTLTGATYERFRRAQALLRHAVPAGDAAEISCAAFEHRLQQLLSDGEPWTVYFSFRMVGPDTGVLVRFDGKGKVAD